MYLVITLVFGIFHIFSQFFRHILDLSLMAPPFEACEVIRNGFQLIFTSKSELTSIRRSPLQYTLPRLPNQ